MSSRDLTNYISELTDGEIFENIGVYVPYDSRDELVTNIVAAITRLRFMYPSKRSLVRSHNKETLMMTEITDVETFMVCYGTALKYYTYELADLTAAFHRDEETHVMEFRRPENPNLRFTQNDIEGLVRLLQCFPPTPDIALLIERINEALIDAREKIAHDDVARRELLVFDKATQGLVREFLRQIFFTGMYMRRWKGPGNPFPVAENDTKDKKEPDEKVTHEVGTGMEILKQMGPLARAFCMNLKICQYNRDGGIDHGAITFNGEWDGVVKGNQCIRMASTRFIGTGLHYLRALYRETIPGIDVKALDRIV